MPTYKLTIQIDNTGLNTLNAASQLVTIVKETNPTTMPVAWLAFHPEENNVITWTESYSVYASRTQIQAGAHIITSSVQSAAGGNTYRFSSGHFTTGTPGLLPSQYAIFNNDTNFQLLTGGLMQQAGGTIGQVTSPLNATVIPFNNTGTYTPIETIRVFADAQSNNGLVISNVQGDALTVEFTTNVSQTIHYNNATNSFAMGPLS